MSCHGAGGIGQIEFTSYNQIVQHAQTIKKVTASRYMPPWLADPNYQSYTNQILLEDYEIELIQQWVDLGSKEGNRQMQGRSKSSNKQVIADHVVCMTEPYIVKGTNTDNYREFVLETNFDEDKYLRSLKFVPGNTRVVHHAWIFIDDMGIALEYDQKTTSYGYNAFDRMGDGSFKQIPGYLPGFTQSLYPEKTAIRFKKNSTLVMQIHYGPSPIDESDRSCLELFFSKEPVKREVQCLNITEYYLAHLTAEERQGIAEGFPQGDISILQKALSIEAEEVKTFVEKNKVLQDISAISAIPHMHYRGKSFLSFAVTPTNDTINLVKIDNWQFDWQNAYLFKRLIKIPAGSTIYVIGTIDNTSQNPYNPIVPAIKAQFGFGSNDEMVEMIIEYVNYQKGDEDISMEMVDF